MVPSVIWGENILEVNHFKQTMVMYDNYDSV
jgi:hypothetical protein